MKSIVQEKYDKLVIILKDISQKNCMILSTLSVARVWKIMKFISTQKGFERLAEFDSFLPLVIDSILFNKKILEETIDYYIDICNELIPTIEEYEDSDEISGHGSNIMGLSYSIVEELYYFTSIQQKEITEIDRGSCRSFILLPSTVIEQYLNTIYSQNTEYKEIQQKINKSKILQDELERVNKDIEYVGLSDTEKIRERIFKYTALNVLEV